jgi:hypothetical protein
MSPFEGFTAADFDAFAEPKWASNAFNLERLEVKLKLTSLGKSICERAQDWLAGQEMGLTEERPSIFNQHRVSDLTLFFFRNLEARKQLSAILDKAKSIADNLSDPAPHHRHIVLGLRLEQAGAQAGLFLHRDAWIDWKNAVQRCQGYGEPERLTGILQNLPPSVRFGQGKRLQAEAAPANACGCAELLSGFEQAEPWTLFGEFFERDDQRLSDGALVDHLAGLFQALAPLHAFIGWSRQNDFHNLKGVIRQQQEKAQRHFKSLGVGDDVRITKGLAAGRVGVVEEIENRGVVKVRIGLLVMTVKMADLIQP